MRKIILLVIMMTSLNLFAQDEELGKRTTLVFVSSEVIANDNFGKDDFLNWAKKVQEVVGGFMKTEKTNTTLKIIPSWAINEKCSYQVSACPANPVLCEKVLSALKNTESPVAKMAPFELFFTFKFNEGCGTNEKFSPVLYTSNEKLALQLLGQSLLQRKETLRNWALLEVIPVLSYYTANVDKKFEGVRYTGSTLAGKSFLDKKTNTVTDSNPLYWRGIMEMSPGNLIIPVSKIFMYMANDEFDLARRYMGLLYRFLDKKTLAAHYMIGLNNYLDIFYQRHDSLVREGIALHDRGKFEDAIKKYAAVLADYPNSAWALYETSFSVSARDAGRNADKKTASWMQHRGGIYAADPMYPMGGAANNARDGYQLFRRMEIGELFKDGKKTKEDLVRYAAIALDLENYAFAAHVYWYLLTSFGDEKYKGHSLLVYYLYSLQKQGVEQVQSFFKENYKTEFEVIEKERTEAMKNDPLYKSFKEQ